MKRLLMMLLALLALQVAAAEEILTLSNGRRIVVYDDFTWNYLDSSAPIHGDLSQIQDNQPPSFLRQGIAATRDQLIRAIEMYDQGWRYTMPRPKSAQAAWGNSDGRTTWYNGWWYNERTHLYSTATPSRRDSGLYLGDGQNSSNTWRNGGTPSAPDIYMWLLSQTGGPRR